MLRFWIFLTLYNYSLYNSFFTDIRTTYYWGYLVEKQKIKEALNKKPSWKIISQEKKYDTYIVIIGESVNKRYMSLYDYPISNTPFLDSINGTFLNGYISTAPNTASSLPRTLCITDNLKKISYAENVVTLANQARFHTYWISNQGKLGKYDTDISKIAINSHFSYFSKNGDYSMRNTDDDILLPITKKIINQNEKNKVIFIHIMGSHPSPCDRLHGEPIRYKTDINNILDCYLTSIYKTDKFIANLYNSLKKSKNSFSLMYFSDHGMTVTNSKPYIYTKNKTKENYEIPFAILNSDDTERKMITKSVSAFNFIDIFADWIGVQTNLTKDNFSIENCEPNDNIKVFNWEKVIDYNSLSDTPILLPQDNLQNLNISR